MFSGYVLPKVKLTTIDGKEVESLIYPPTIEIDKELLDDTMSQEYDSLSDALTFSCSLANPSLVKKMLQKMYEDRIKYLRTKKSIKKRKKHYWR